MCSMGLEGPLVIPAFSWNCLGLNRSCRLWRGTIRQQFPLSPMGVLADMKKDVMLPRSDFGVHNISSIFFSKKKQNNSHLHMIETFYGSSTFYLIVRTLVCNLQNFPRSWITKITTFFMSGSSLPGLRKLSPPSTPAELFRNTCLQSYLQTSPATPQKSYPKFRNPRTTFGNTPLCPPNCSIVRGVGWVPNFC